MKNIPICFLPALPGDDTHLVLAKHDTRTLFVFSTVSVCHWCPDAAILSKCWWTCLCWSALTAPVVIRTVIDNFLANNCVKNGFENHYKYQWERKVCWSCTLYIHACGFLAAQEKACRFSCSEDMYVEDVLTQGYWFHAGKAGCHTDNCEGTELLPAERNDIGTTGDYFCSTSNGLLLLRLLTGPQRC